MTQYIDKSAVAAEIKSLMCTTFTTFDEGVNATAKILLEYINTLEVKEVDSNKYEDGYEQGYADAHPHWISVDDELPEENKWVLTYNGASINLLILAGNGGWYDHSVAKHRNVTHWMPLPEPPAKLSNVERTGKGGDK